MPTNSQTMRSLEQIVDLEFNSVRQALDYFDRAPLWEINNFLSRRRTKRLRKVRLFIAGGLLTWLVAVSLVAVVYLPQLAYAIFPETTQRLALKLGETIEVSKSGFGEEIYIEEKALKPMYVPPYDPSLPVENRLVIEKIGVDTVIGEGEEWESVIETGVWRAGEFGDPENPRLPIILAAHRFGYLKWTNTYRRQNSFYNLPKLENGDQIVIIWKQRRYVYEIYEGYTDTKIRDFNTDLILFTCQVLTSDERIVRVARLVIPEADKTVASR